MTRLKIYLRPNKKRGKNSLFENGPERHSFRRKLKIFLKKRRPMRKRNPKNIA